MFGRSPVFSDLLKHKKRGDRTKEVIKEFVGRRVDSFVAPTAFENMFSQALQNQLAAGQYFDQQPPPPQSPYGQQYGSTVTTGTGGY